MNDESTPDPKQAESATERDYIQLDAYSIKARVPIKTRPVAEEELTVLKVLASIWQSLLQSALHSFALVPDILKCGRSLVRGLGDLPAAVNQRVRGAQELAEREEERASEIIDVQVTETARKESALSIHELLETYRERGLAAHIRLGPNGELIVYVVRPELEEATITALEEIPKLETKLHNRLFIDLSTKQLHQLGIVEEDEVGILESLGFLSIRDLSAEPGKATETLEITLSEVMRAESLRKLASLSMDSLPKVPYLSWPLSVLNATVTTRSALANANLETLGDLMEIQLDRFLKSTTGTPESMAGVILELKQRMGILGVVLWD